MRGFHRNTHSLPIQIALVQKTSLAKISLAKISFDIETHPWSPRQHAREKKKERAGRGYGLPSIGGAVSVRSCPVLPPSAIIVEY